MHNKGSMHPVWWLKTILVFCALLFGVLYTLPTFLGHPAQWERNDQGEPVSLPLFLAEKLLPENRLQLGLDLKGGLSLTLNVDLDKAVKDSLTRALDRVQQSFLADGFKPWTFQVHDDFSVTVNLDKTQFKESAPENFQKKLSEQTLLLLYDKKKDFTLFFKSQKAAVASFKTQIMEQAIHTIRNRIDQFGVAEPSIFQAGDARIIVELPGMSDPSRAKELLGNTAQLDFRLVLNDVPKDQLSVLLETARTELKISKETALQPAVVEQLSQWLRTRNKIPQNSTILLFRQLGQGSKSGQVVSSQPYLVEAHSKLTGDLIEDAQAVQTTENYVPQYSVSLKFKPQGAKIFADLTTQAADANHSPHELAIILDGNVQSSPYVKSPITGGSASITLGNTRQLSSQMKQAQDLALVLRTGALPASVQIVEERQVGPSEGEQNIRAGIISTVVAAVLVALVMFFIYGFSGFVANIAMIFNILLILAFMALLGATLTLPGIAGIVLTLSIAVDGNVIINERIREEIRSGLHQRQAFYKGYATSFRTLVDAHFTSAVAGLVLLLYGNPTVRGFAVTLLCGIFCTLFTSYYVTEVIGQWLVERTKIKRFG
jgi:preprotein translocase subunit SecD